MSKKKFSFNLSDLEPGVFLTGDVHHNSGTFREQKYLNTSEIAVACRYAEILSEYGSACTLFCTGISFRDSIAEIEELERNENVELGGHTYNCYQPKAVYRSWKKMTGRSNGPAVLQSWDIKKTVSIAESTIGKSIKSWRNHAYRCDKNTDEILAKNGIRVVSNEVSPDAGVDIRNTNCGDIVSLGLNVWPDHEHLVHGDLVKEQEGKRNFRNSGFDDKVFSSRDWLYQVESSIDTHLENGRHAVILAHPGCMMVLDDLKTFRDLCKIISKYTSYKCHDLLAEPI